MTLSIKPSITRAFHHWRGQYECLKEKNGKNLKAYVEDQYAEKQGDFEEQQLTKKEIVNALVDSVKQEVPVDFALKKKVVANGVQRGLLETYTKKFPGKTEQNVLDVLTNVVQKVEGFEGKTLKEYLGSEGIFMDSTLWLRVEFVKKHRTAIDEMMKQK